MCEVIIAKITHFIQKLIENKKNDVEAFFKKLQNQCQIFNIEKIIQKKHAM